MQTPQQVGRASGLATGERMVYVEGLPRRSKDSILPQSAPSRKSIRFRQLNFGIDSFVGTEKYEVSSVFGNFPADRRRGT
jgi:hypothetical protein